MIQTHAIRAIKSSLAVRYGSPCSLACCFRYTGLAVAAIGFLVAGLIGVPLARYGIRKGWMTIEGGEIPEHFLRALMDKGDNPVCARSTTHPANIDNVAFHLAIMVALYGVAYAFGVWWLCSMPKPIS